MQLLFWLSVSFVLYVYVGYPLLLMMWARLRPAQPSASSTGLSGVPTISIVIAARNEARRLAARIDNLLGLDYPPALRQIIVVSDGSTDDTLSVLGRYRNEVDVVEVPGVGKAAALNAGVAIARGEVLVFADARQTFHPQVAKALIAPLADPAVGVVSGELVLGCEPGAGRRRLADRRVVRAAIDTVRNLRRYDRRTDRTSAMAEGVRRYWGYEKELRRLESVVGSMVGATGAVYAMRRPLWRSLPPGTILDDVLAPMRAVLAGARIVFEPAAQAYDQTAPDATVERRRKTRTLAGNYQILWSEPRLLIPFVNPVWLQYVSHKIGRLLIPYALLGILVSSVVLARSHAFYTLALLGQMAFYLEAAYGWWLTRRRDKVGAAPRTLVQRAGAIAFAFMLMNASAMAAPGLLVFGRRVWR